jgi:hypothetical protein
MVGALAAGRDFCITVAMDVEARLIRLHWKQYMSTDTAPSCHRHAGSLNDPHSSVGVPKASVSSCFTAAKPSCALGGRCLSAG